jgi:predicted ATP-dependent serine protease
MFPIVSAPPVPRRFVCRACGYSHVAWAPRCKSCLSLAGLAMTDGSAPSAPPVLKSVDPVSVLDEAKPQAAEPEPMESARPRLVVARAPEPDLADPVEELADVASTSIPVPLTDVTEIELPRDSTGLAPLDAVLGGGLVAGAAIVMAGSAGCGKSTLTMQMLAGLNLRALLATGEETVQQAGARARRIGALSRKVFIVAETDLAIVFEHAHKMRAQVLMVDSIQTLVCGEVAGNPGSPTQVRECASRLVKFAKTTDISVIVTAHMTGDDRIAGPSTLRHLVDVVLELEAGARFEGNERILRCSGKNRFGPANVVGHFELTEKGLVAVDGDGWNEEL